jgi:hypothetical protein
MAPFSQVFTSFFLSFKFEGRRRYLDGSRVPCRYFFKASFFCFYSDRFPPKLTSRTSWRDEILLFKKFLNFFFTGKKESQGPFVGKTTHFLVKREMEWEKKKTFVLATQKTPQSNLIHFVNNFVRKLGSVSACVLIRSGKLFFIRLCLCMNIQVLLKWPTCM